MSIKHRLNKLEKQSDGDWKVEVLKNYFDEDGQAIEDNSDNERLHSILVNGEHVYRQPDELATDFEIRACAMKKRDTGQHIVLSRSDMDFRNEYKTASENI